MVRRGNVVSQVASAARRCVCVLLAAAVVVCCPGYGATQAGPAAPAAATSGPSIQERIRALIEVLGSDPEPGPHASYGPSAAQRKAMDDLVRIGNPAVEPLIQALHDRNDWRRGLSVETLSRLKDRRAVEPLIQALRRDRGDGVRSAAATALGELGDRHAVAPLIAALKDRKIGVRYYAAIALGTFRDPRSVQPLVRLLGDGETWPLSPGTGPASAAADTLVKIGRPGVPALLRAVAHRRSGGRAWAARALGVIGDRRAARALTTARRDPDQEVREAAADALRTLRKGRPRRP